MKVLTDNFQGTIVRYAVISGNGILFNTLDVCWVLGIVQRPSGTLLSEVCLNIAGVIETALTDESNTMPSVNMPFVKWIESRFAGHDIDTPVQLNCDGDWKLSRAGLKG